MWLGITNSWDPHVNASRFANHRRTASTLYIYCSPSRIYMFTIRAGNGSVFDMSQCCCAKDNSPSATSHHSIRLNMRDIG